MAFVWIWCRIFATTALLAPVALSHLLPRDTYSKLSPRVGHESGNGTQAHEFGIGLVNTADDLLYNINIVVGGRAFSVALDTGSSDLVIYSRGAPLKILNDSGLYANETYGDGTVDFGPVQFAEVQIGEYIIPSQAFVNVNETNDSAPSDGVFGILFDNTNLSPVERAIQGAWGLNTTLGRTPVSNILAQNSSLLPLYDMALGRSLDLGEDAIDGSFIIGRYAPGHEEIAEAPEIPVVVMDTWSVVVDGLSVNGNNYTFKPSSAGTAVPKGTLTAMLDSGTSDMSMPADVVDFIYAQYPRVGSIQRSWYAPCYSGANVTLYFGGQAIPVHPLDLAHVTSFTLKARDGSAVNTTVCEPRVDRMNTAVGGGLLDMILGDTFLKNVYMSYNFGQLPTRISNATGAYVQMLPTTDRDAAWTDFLASRQEVLAHHPHVIDPIVMQQLFPADFPTDLPTNTSDVPSASPSAGGGSSAVAGALSDAHASAAGAASSGPSSDGGAVASLLGKYGPVVIGLLAGNILVMLILCIIALAACMRGVVRSGATTRAVSLAMRR